MEGEDEPWVFIVNDDGSLSSESVPDAFMPICLKKRQ
jgi:hypothetical protein